MSRPCFLPLFLTLLGLALITDIQSAFGRGRWKWRRNHCPMVLIPDQEKPTQTTDKNWGTITGRIIWGGKELPKRQLIAAAKKFGLVLDEQWVVHGKNRGLRDTFVWLAPKEKNQKMLIHPALQKAQGPKENGEFSLVYQVTPFGQKHDFPGSKAVVDSVNGRFVPHAVGMREGQILLVKNSLPVAVSPKWFGHPDFNPGGIIFLKPNNQHEINNLVAHRIPLLLECNLHPWMRAWIRVFDHPYFAVTNENGAFEIKKAPAGEFRLFIWHPSGGWLGGVHGRNGRPIAIPGGKVLDLGEAKFPPPD